MKPNCPKCNSERWMTDLVVSGEPYVCVKITWSTNVGVTQFLAQMCADCGYTEFYAKDPETVWEEWAKENR
jgi:predicted nucleic-acid-binding Zn-ribbon protein